MTRRDHQDPNAERYSVPARPDTSLLDDDSTLATMFMAERMILPSRYYFTEVQVVVREEMRRTLTEWMFEVCMEERCDRDVFPLAVSFVDRFLSVEAVHIDQLQCLGTACMMLASKVVEPQQIPSCRLLQYTDFSVDIGDLLSWEMLVLKSLDWKTNSVTAHNFLAHYLYRLKLPLSVESCLLSQLEVLVAMSAMEFRFAVLPQSMIAACCLCVAFARLVNDGIAIPAMARQLQLMTGINANVVLHYSLGVAGLVEGVGKKVMEAQREAILNTGRDDATPDVTWSENYFAHRLFFSNDNHQAAVAAELKLNL
ncbi:G1/S-specific cyclin-D2 [Trichinella zimbabwensis]|uniref:G1/S-specific cyclin-D2 n=1 Tax=Trichinella zimbabwensis TaxID=268475 RepID=A0A0V1I172_9BILA|nr:G1/S-specific cyclin-D2 [Trichinella zimbabwensis]KRZ16665.1 G1/S-specific cyclin-D2 [Trichinella zimbabwensis]